MTPPAATTARARRRDLWHQRQGSDSAARRRDRVRGGRPLPPLGADEIDAGLLQRARLGHRGGRAHGEDSRFRQASSISRGGMPKVKLKTGTRSSSTREGFPETTGGAGGPGGGNRARCGTSRSLPARRQARSSARRVVREQVHRERRDVAARMARISSRSFAGRRTRQRASSPLPRSPPHRGSRRGPLPSAEHHGC